ncbi:alpha/beta-hydrolase [Leptodontidium sp. 2 PMI_412]|nr:alpha/beta-hydrolase [Leptodontidium sp. 2 PMI_412]
MIEPASPRCSDITIPVTISSQNADLPSGFSLADPDAGEIIANLMFNVSIHGSYNIAATFCEPEVYVPTRANTLQLLVHGATYARSFWSGVGFGDDEYSWIAFASMQGYPTLSIDRLGNGLSDHPDPVAVIQIPAHVEVVHAIAQLAKAPDSTLPRAFQKVIYIGHSVGSVTGNALNVKYPHDVDATILTGFSSSLPQNPPVVNFLVPASVEDPKRFGSLLPGYLQVSSEPAVIASFYSPGGFDPALAHFDFETRDTITVGEIVTLDYSVARAPGYTAPLLVSTGEFDELYCNPRATPNQTASCKTPSGNILAQTEALYPSAKPYTWNEVSNAGHNWPLHFAGQIGFKAAHDWLGCVGF